MNTLALQDALGACCSGWFVNTLALQDVLGGMLFGVVCEYPCPSGCIGGHAVRDGL